MPERAFPKFLVGDRVIWNSMHGVIREVEGEKALVHWGSSMQREGEVMTEKRFEDWVALDTLKLSKEPVMHGDSQEAIWDPKRRRKT